MNRPITTQIVKTIKPIAVAMLVLFILHEEAAYGGIFAKDAYELPPAIKPSHDSNIELLDKMEQAFRKITKQATPAVLFISIYKDVQIPNYYYLDPFENFFRGFPFGGRGFPNQRPHDRQGRDHDRNPHQHQNDKKRQFSGVGSGFIIDKKMGYILTNNHVVGDADEISVKTYDGKTYEAKVVGADKNTDVAIIQVKNLPDNLHQIFLADSDQVHVGDWAIAVGAPHQLDQTVTRGTVSAKGRGSLNITGYGDFIQTDAAINPGNSGGPLINIHGQAIGMNTAIFSKSGGSQGLGFAIPSNIIKRIALQLINHGKATRAKLGVQIQNISPELAKEFGLDTTEGVLIAHVEPESPAQKGGLQAGDFVTHVDGKSVDNTAQLQLKISMSPLDRKVKVTFFRDGKKRHVDIYLTTFNEEKSPTTSKKENGNRFNDWGLNLQPNDSQLQEEFRLETRDGLVITGIKNKSPAEHAELQVGDVIVAINRKNVNSIQDFNRLAKNKKMVLLRVARGNYFLFFPLQK